MALPRIRLSTAGVWAAAGHVLPPAEPYRRRRRADAEELANYLGELEAEVARIRRELDELRKPDTAES